MSYWRFDFHHESRLGIVLSDSRHSSKCLRILRSEPLDLQGRSTPNGSGLVMPEHTLP